MLRLRATIWRNLRQMGEQARMMENDLSGRAALWKRPSNGGRVLKMTAHGHVMLAGFLK